jgi:hypothetical protein
MSLKNDDYNDHPLKHKESILNLDSASHTDAQANNVKSQNNSTQKSPPEKPQHKNLAQELDTGRHIHYAYAVLDSLSSSYSMFKYGFDIGIGGTTDHMHDFMISPAGIAGITLESVFLVSFSFLACHFDGEEEGTYNKRIADAWPYFRDVMKALKNAYKGWRSTAIALDLLGVADYKASIIPASIFLGVLAIANRYLMRSITEPRKKMMNMNKTTLAKFIKLSSLTAEEKEAQLALTPIQYQTDASRRLGFLGSAIAGVVDGLYLYAGVLTLSPLAPPLLIAMASLCAVYTLACIITRLYEEYDFQLRLVILQTKCHFVMETKQLQTSYAELLLLDQQLSKTPEELLKVQELRQDLCKLIEQYDERYQLLKKQSNHTYFTSFLLGIKTGLHAYGALSSVLFLASSFLAMGGVTVPPLVIAITVSLGLVFIIGALIRTLGTHYQYLRSQENLDAQHPHQQLFVLKQSLEDKAQPPHLLTMKQLNDELKKSLSVHSTPASLDQETFEVFRSFFSGLGKGQKFVDFSGNPLQEIGEDGHYHDTPVMYLLGSLSALLFAFILALRALARGFGRAPLGEDIDLAAAAYQPVKRNDLFDEPIAIKTLAMEPVKTESQGGEVQGVQRGHSSPRGNDSPRVVAGFFKVKSSSTLPLAESDKALKNLDYDLSTIGDLTSGHCTS